MVALDWKRLIPPTTTPPLKRLRACHN
jgi:hypothetical protein